MLLLLSLLLPLISLVYGDDLPTCQPKDFHYSFTECDADGGRWRVSVPTKPDHCIGGSPNAPIRVPKCFESCPPGTFFNRSSLLCDSCQPGTYSLGGGIKMTLNESSLKEHGFRFKTESKNYNVSETNCPRWTVANSTLEVRSTGKSSGGCVSVITFSSKIVKPKDGLLRFVYSYVQPNDLANSMILFSFHYRNFDDVSSDEDTGDMGDLRTSSNYFDPNYEIKFPPPTDKRKQWSEVTIKLRKSGLYAFMWRAVTIGTHLRANARRRREINSNSIRARLTQQARQADDGGYVLIKSIELNGAAYASECTPCEPGYYADQSRTTRCLPCPKNTFADVPGYQECRRCDNNTHYSTLAATKCTEKPICGPTDYYATKGDCDLDAKSQRVEYKWIEPKICRDGVLPPVSQQPCNASDSKPRSCSAGTELVGGKCVFCKESTYNDGTMDQCQRCPPTTTAIHSLVMNSWMGPERNTDSSVGNLLAMQCILSGENFDIDAGDCDSDWKVTPAVPKAYLRTPSTAQLDALMILALQVNGFRHSSGGQIQFEFELVGSDSLLFFTEIREGDSSRASNEIIERWEGDTGGVKIFRYDIHENLTATYSWMYRRYEHIQSHARIYSIEITNTIQSGAVRCATCHDQSQCVPCPTGQYLETPEERADAELIEDRPLHSSASNGGKSSSDARCVTCPAGTIINSSLTFPRGQAESCIACGPGLISDPIRVNCFGNCTLRLDGDSYDLSKLPRPLSLKAGNLFTTGGTAYYHAFNFTICGRPIPALCRDNNTDVLVASYQDLKGSYRRDPGIRALACRSTLLPDQGQVYSTQSVSLGDRLVAISRQPQIGSIRVNPEFTGVRSDIHFFYATDTGTNACPQGRSLTVTLRCDLQLNQIALVTAPSKCPEGTCDGCVYHLLVRSNTSAACRTCHDDDYETVIGECVAGKQIVHFINPKGCVIPEHKRPMPRPCAVLPQQVQYAITFGALIGVVLVALLIHFWKKNRALEYKYSKLIDNEKMGDDQELAGAECCIDDDEDDTAQINVKIRQIKREPAGDYDGYETIQLTKHTDDAL